MKDTQLSERRFPETKEEAISQSLKQADLSVLACSGPTKRTTDIFGEKLEMDFFLLILAVAMLSYITHYQK